jgi:hypothetical protein
MTTMQNLTAGK